MDTTPDSSDKEQTVFVIRYLNTFEVITDQTPKQLYKIVERFLEFVDFSSKTGETIAELIRCTLKKHTIWRLYR